MQRKVTGAPLHPEYAAMDAASLARVPKPCVVCLRWGPLTSHMVAVMGVDEATVTLADPLSGTRVMTRKEFEQDWRGRVIWLARRALAPRHAQQLPRLLAHQRESGGGRGGEGDDGDGKPGPYRGFVRRAEPELDAHR